MRVAFTIILNGLRHLTHNHYYKTIIENFDYWVIVEGVSQPNDSTSWCKNLDLSFHKNFLSNDGTTEFLNTIHNDKVKIIRNVPQAPFYSKDEQVNAAIKYIRNNISVECKLWQIDIDEQWKKEDLENAENDLVKNKGKTGCFLCNYFVGTNQQVFGQWGEGRDTPYRRLWDWKGELFLTHEPPILAGKNGPGFLLPQRFNHYAYYFEEDVKFKEAYYGDYEGLFERWKNIQSNRGTIHIRNLLGPKIWWSNTNTTIQYKP